MKLRAKKYVIIKARKLCANQLVSLHWLADKQSEAAGNKRRVITGLCPKKKQKSS
jgi:hypothetical protein